MKKLSYLALAAVGLLLGACSSDRDVADESQVPSSLDGKGQGFLNVSINLPTQPVVSTRADGWSESEQLDDGDANEYAVQSVLIVIFGGASEAAATIQQIESPDAGEADSWNKIGSTKDQVTTRKNYVFELKKGLTGPYYALAIINGNGIVDKDGDAGLKVTGLFDGEIKTKSLGSCTISDLQKAISKAADDGKHKFINSEGYFFMTNAVLSEVKGGTSAVNSAKGFILAPVTNIFDSKEAADANNANPSTDIYVERGVAKVTLSTSSTDFKFVGVTAKTGTLATPSLSGWVLDNTNMKSYIVRQTPTDVWGWGLASKGSAAVDKYRFVGYNGVDQTTPTVTEAYRTYWCVDPNYATAYDKADFYEPATKTFPASTTAPQYCYENTFSVANQSYKNTTRAVVKLDLNGGTDFYTLGTDRKTLYQEADAKKVVIARLVVDANFKKWFMAKSSVELNEGCIKSVEWTSDDKAGVIKVKDITVNGDKLTAGSDVKVTTINETIGGTDIKGTEIMSAIASLYGTIKRYVKGATYYSIRIKHFGDALTPWGWNGEKESSIDDIYPATDRDANYLGRYGMVRNNWYELSLGNILKIGSAVVPKINPDNPNPDPDDPDPEDPDHPDDSLDDTFINARINILSWAKRPQSWIMK